MKRSLVLLIVFGILLGSLQNFVFSGDTVQAASVKYGDLNGDGSVNSIDFALMRSYLIGAIFDFPAPDGKKAGDVNGDNAVNSIDFAYMRSFLLGLISRFPAEDIPVATPTATPTATPKPTPTATPVVASIVVAKYGGGNYTTVQAAINSLGSKSTTPKTIYIKNGDYKEVVTIPSGISNLTIIGESKDAVIHYDNYNGKSNGNGGTYGTGGSASVFIKGSDISVQNITFKNSFIEKGNSNEQAVALNVTGNRVKFFNCNFLGNQDTLLCDGGTQYFYKCLVAGDVDFIFGRSQAVFEQCEIRSLNRGSSSNNGYITAARTEKTAAYGLVFLNCRLTCESGTARNSVWLGRPWCPSGTDVNKPAVAYINCTMDAHIKTEGWTSMSGVSPSHGRFYEYQSVGSGAAVNSSRPQLSASDAAKYTKSNVLGGWNPSF